MGQTTPTGHSLVIGGTRGIGRAVVRTLASRGRSVSVAGRRPPYDEDRRTDNVTFWEADLTNDVLVSRTLRDILRHGGELSDLVFLQRYRGDGDDWSNEIQTSLTVTRTVIDSLADHFDDRGAKSIVIVGSVAARFIADEQPLSYHVAKAGLTQMVRFYAVALGPKGLRVNGVSPGTVLKDESKDYYLGDPGLHHLYERMIPLGRMGTAEDVANVVEFLCSPKAAFLTGQNIVVDGGLSLQWHESLVRRLVGKPGRTSSTPQ